jgi:hypothetical protein
MFKNIGKEGKGKGIGYGRGRAMVSFYFACFSFAILFVQFNYFRLRQYRKDDYKKL